MGFLPSYRARVDLKLTAPHIETAIPGPKSKAIVAKEEQHIAPGLQGFAQSSGIAVERAAGSVIEDVDGNRFVDLIGGIGVNALGHCHPAYREALHAQIDKATVGSFTSQVRADLISEVAEVAPKGVDRLQLYSSGAEAVESAFRLAKNATGKFEVAGFWGGFHGKTMGAPGVDGAGKPRRYGATPPRPGPPHPHRHPRPPQPPDPTFHNAFAPLPPGPPS